MVLDQTKRFKIMIHDISQIDLDALAERLAGRVVEKLALRLPPLGQSPSDPEVLLAEDQAASLLGVKGATLASWRSRGRLHGNGPPFIRLGDSKKPAIRYKRGDLIAWAADRRHRNTNSKIGAEAEADG